MQIYVFNVKDTIAQDNIYQHGMNSKRLIDRVP